MSIHTKLTEIFRMVFDDDEIVIEASTTANDIDGWDSLSHVNLIVAAERSFNIKFNKKELLTFRNVGDLTNSITAKIAEQG